MVLFITDIDEGSSLHHSVHESMHTSVKVVLTDVTAATPTSVDASVSFFRTGADGEPTNNSNSTLKKPPCDAEGLQEHSPSTQSAPVQHISFHTIVRWGFL